MDHLHGRLHDDRVGYLLTKDAGSTCGLNISVDDGRTWTNVLSDNGPGGYRVNATLPVFAEGEGGF